MSFQRLAGVLASFVVTATAATAAWAQTCAPPALADKVELKPVAGTHLMTVPVAINGTAKQFLLDVGSNGDEISQSAVGELNLTPVDQRTAANTTATINPQLQFLPTVVDVRGTNGVPLPQVRAATFTMGGNTLQNMRFLVSNDRDLGKSKPYDGLLTAAGFQKYDMDMDFGGRQLSFLTATACADPGQIARWPHAALAVIPMTMANGKISIPVTIEGHAIDAVIDTGSDKTVMRRAVAERLFGLKADTPEMTVLDGVRDGAGERVYQHTFPQITFEGVAASNVPALIQANSMVRAARSAATTGSRLSATPIVGTPVPDLTLGMDVLSQLHIYAAFGQGKLYVTPAG